MGWKRGGQKVSRGEISRGSDSDGRHLLLANISLLLFSKKIVRLDFHVSWLLFSHQPKNLTKLKKESSFFHFHFLLSTLGISFFHLEGVFFTSIAISCSFHVQSGTLRPVVISIPPSKKRSKGKNILKISGSSFN